MEIVFYDIETTIPATDIIEFGAIVLDKTGLYEKDSYSTLIFSNRLTDASIACNGITDDILKGAPSFSDVAENIFSVLNNKIWAGHNIIKFDNVHIRKAFDMIGKPAPEPLEIIDTLPLLRNTFGKRAGNMKLAALGKYFGLGQEQHRSIEDCRMNLEVLKKCALTMYLEKNTNYSIAGGESFSESDNLIKTIDAAIEEGKDLWISYDGRRNPLIPRKIKPIRWVHYPLKIEAFCYQSKMAKDFTQSKIRDAREQEWLVDSTDCRI